MMRISRQIKLLFVIVSLFLFTAGCGIFTQETTAKKQWTIIMYLDGDEFSMQQDFIAAFVEMISDEAGSTDDVNVLIQFDRYPTIPTNEAFGGWIITHRFHYTPRMEPTPEAAISDWGDGLGGGREVDMADPDTLSAFINWSVSNYPAHHYMLVIADHGYGWRGLVIDETSQGNFMPLKGLESALENAPHHIDLLALDACTMQMIEVLHELKDLPIDIVVGSENLGTTWPFADIIKTVAADPAITAEALGKTINDLYYQAHPTDDQITLSTLRLGKINPITNAVEELATEILASSPFTTVQTKAAQVMDRIEEAVVYSKNGSSWETTANGLSIYFPPFQQNYMPHIPDQFFYNYIEEVVSFAADSRWRDFLYVYYNMSMYPNVIDGNIYTIRDAMPLFDDVNIDLYDFCKRIVNYQ